jgi:DNA repair protein RadA/Sms
MRESGLAEVGNPSAVFLAERPNEAPGSVVTASMEGTRPILIELQALVSGSSYGTPRRTILGLDANRVALLVAVMEKKLGLHLIGQDVFMNVAGGVKVVEPAVDLAVAAAIAASFTDKAVPEGTLIVGEVGLTGEVRAVGHVEIRAAEAAKMGFKRCIVPHSNLRRLDQRGLSDIIGVRTLEEALETIFV